jgi:hypothetical protein
MVRLSPSPAVSPRSAEEIAGAVILQQVGGINHRHHRIEPRYVGEAQAVLVTEIERGGDRQRLGNTGRFDQQVIEPPLLGERPHLFQEIIPQCAADAAIGHFHQLLLGAGEIGAAIAHKGGIDIHLAHIVDDDGDAHALAIPENMIEQRRLAGAEEAREHGDGKSLVHCNLA